jgi:Tannase and feruloyl esterase
MIRIALLGMTLGCWLVAPNSALAATGSCNLESIRSITPADAVIDAVKQITSTVAHCEVTGHIITTNPGPNRVEFGLMMPDDNFNGRYYFIGEGAAAGFVPTTTGVGPLAAYYVGTTWKLLSEGFAVAGSDTGHKGLMWDFGIDNPAARLDHGHRGAHVSAVATQAITRAYYAMKQQLYRYHLGCSGGGRMGAMAVFHHPEDFDGAVVSTGFGGGGSDYFPWIMQYVLRNPDSWISPQKLAFMERKVAAKCAGPDGLVRDPKACGFDPVSLQCKAADNDECLTAAQIKLVERITGPYPIGPGKTSGGFTLTTPTGWSSFLIGNSRPTNTNPNNPWARSEPTTATSIGEIPMFGGPGTPPSSYGITHSMLRGFYFNNAKFDFRTDLDFNDQATLQQLYDHHPDLGVLSTDISAFKKAGGKLILWAGIGENAVPPATEIEYFNALKDAVPGRDDFVRLYLAPGVLHCAGGTGPQDTPDRLLEKVIAWREEGARPDAVVTSAATPTVTPGVPPAGATAAPIPSRTVLLCPYPKTAVFKGKKGAFPYDASKWQCE